MALLFSFIILFIFLNLWKYIYEDPNELINGYSMNQMIWYVIITEILWMSLGGRKLCRKICNDVRCGNIAYNINKPYSYIGYSVFSHLGAITLKAIIYTILQEAKKCKGKIIGALIEGDKVTSKYFDDTITNRYNYYCFKTFFSVFRYFNVYLRRFINQSRL